MALRDNMVPTLNGAQLVVTDDGYAFANGDPVPSAQLNDVVFVNPSASAEQDPAQWWQASDLVGLGHLLFERATPPAPPQAPPDTAKIDVAALLGSLPGVQQAPPVEVNAGFFHLSLSSWLGLELGSTPSASPTAQTPTWDYAFWKAVVEETSEALGPEIDGCRVQTYRAEIFRGDGSAPEEYRYWLATGDDGAIVQSGWLSAEPDLLASEDSFDDADGPLDAEVLRGLLSESEPPA